MRFVSPGKLVVLGAALVIVGFLYDVMFAGLPFQDPTPTMQEQWLRKKDIANKLVLTGFVVLCGGCAWKFAQWIYARRGG